MVTKIAVQLEDDLDGGPATETVDFAYKGRAYVIDLSKGNAMVFDEIMRGWIEVATDVTYKRRSRPKGRTAASRQRSRDIRDWARDQGIPVTDRGRLAGNVIKRYEAEQEREAS